MLSYFFGITALGAVRPYFRKHVYGTLEPIDFLFINSLLIAICVTAYFAYLYNYENHVLAKTYDNCCKLTATQIGALLLLAAFTVVGSIWFFHLEKYYNTPFVNNILIKSFSILALFVVGYFIFEEKYSSTHMVGIGLTVIGLTILLFNPVATPEKVKAISF
jgi:multidrug transporter EmrE-like cation transporter